MMLREQPVAIPWFRPEDYDCALQIMADADRLPQSYGAWRRCTEELRAQLRQAGLLARPVEVDPAAFLDWCRSLDLMPDEAARVQYVNDLLCVAPEPDG